jgi:hypothetical protein
LNLYYTPTKVWKQLDQRESIGCFLPVARQPRSKECTDTDRVIYLQSFEFHTGKIKKGSTFQQKFERKVDPLCFHGMILDKAA